MYLRLPCWKLFASIRLKAICIWGSGGEGSKMLGDLARASIVAYHDENIQLYSFVETQY
jgi:tRNA A37 threonylcarbamoyladenosine dehydratase